MKFIKEEATKANTHGVTMFDRRRGWFNVEETMYHNERRPKGYYRVELDRGWCDCGKFQAFHKPCNRVIEACSHARQDPSNLLSGVYKFINVYNVYNNIFLVVAKEEY